MNPLDREFNRTEKLLLLALGLILVAAAYYELVFLPTSTDLRAARAQRDTLEMELTNADTRLAQLDQMQDEMNHLDYSTQSTRMASYNDSENELALLNNILGNTEQYSISFKDVTQDGNIVRRSFTMQFTARDIETVDLILMRLTNGGRRCLIGDVTCAAAPREDGKRDMNVTLVATFYETMAGGAPDSGLPAAEP